MGTILVIDDQMELRTLYKRVLEHAGYTVVTAEGGKQALCATESWVPDLVLLDMAMPQMNGLEFLRAARSRAGWEHVPVIVLSGLLTAEQIAAARALGAGDQLLKGQFSTRDLRARVAKYLPTTPARPSCTAA